MYICSMKYILIALILCVAKFSISQKNDFGISAGVMDVSTDGIRSKSTYGYTASAFLERYISDVSFFGASAGAIERGGNFLIENRSVRATEWNPYLSIFKGWKIPTAEKCKPKVLGGVLYDFQEGNSSHVSYRINLSCSWNYIDVGFDFIRSLNSPISDQKNLRYQNIGMVVALRLF